MRTIFSSLLRVNYFNLNYCYTIKSEFVYFFFFFKFSNNDIINNHSVLKLNYNII